MEFLDEDARPRFVLQSKSIPQSTSSSTINTTSTSYISSLHKPTLFISISFAVLFLTLSFFTFNFEPLKSLLIWVSLSLLLGPFAPPSLTAGDISVGLGPPLKPLLVIEDETDSNSTTSKKFNKKSARAVTKIESLVGENASDKKKDNGYALNLKKTEGVASKEARNEMMGKGIEEGKWSEGDVEMLKKLMGKHPVGKPGRWEAITEGFKGRYKVESVIKKSKELGEKKVSDEDSFKKFLKDRKPVDRRMETENGSEVGNAEVKGETAIVWSAGEDLALLNALKAFPKEVAMRWEKIAAAVPGKSKAACVKRVAELKREFRSSKATPREP